MIFDFLINILFYEKLSNKTFVIICKEWTLVGSYREESMFKWKPEIRKNLDSWKDEENNAERIYR